MYSIAALHYPIAAAAPRLNLLMGGPPIETSATPANLNAALPQIKIIQKRP